MKASASGKTLGSSFSQYARRKAEENGITSGGKLWESFKEKVQGGFYKVQEKTKRGASARRISTGDKRAKSAGPAVGAAVDEELVSEMLEMLSEMSMSSSISKGAVKLALSKSRAANKGLTSMQHKQVACDWLLDDKNVEAIEAANYAEVERNVADAMPHVVQKILDRKRRDSSPRDDGRGLGFFMKRRSISPQRPSEPSPRKVPMPARLSRGGLNSHRVSTGSRMSIGSQTSEGSEDGPAMTPRVDKPEDLKAHLLDDGSDDGDAKSCGQDAVQGCAFQYTELEESDEELEEEEEVALPPLPPDASKCWDWPLSRQEKKVRVQMLERQMNEEDKRCLKHENSELRSSLRKMSTGGADRPRPSRLST